MFRRRTQSGEGRRTRLFFATDIHGSEHCFLKWLNAVHAYEVDVLILGGDLTGKAIVPLTGNGGGWRGEFLGRRIEARTEAELAQLRRSIRAAGYYDAVLTREEKEELDRSEELRASLFRRVIAESVERWMAIADERLQPLRIPSFAILGNDDFPELAETIRDSRAVEYAEDRVYELPSGLELVSFGYSTPTPWATPRELPDPEMASQIESLLAQIRDPGRAIFNFHSPPKDTHLDQAPMLNAELRPVVDAAGSRTISAGSVAVRAAIERYGPALGLHGHVHECAAAQRIGTTLCINPGSDYSEGVLRGAIVDIDQKRGVRRWQLTHG